MNARRVQMATGGLSRHVYCRVFAFHQLSADIPAVALDSQELGVELSRQPEMIRRS